MYNKFHIFIKINYDEAQAINGLLDKVVRGFLIVPQSNPETSSSIV